MICPKANQTSSLIGHDIILTCVVLMLDLILSLAGNIWLLLRFAPRKKKSLQGDRILPRTLAVWGIMHALLNIPIYTTSIIAGQWLFGGAFCQIFGLLSSITTGCWLWFLALASLERYYKLALPNEYSSMYSDINTKILLWGVVLFVSMIFISPVYGWAEYSDKRGAIHLLFHTVSQSNHAAALPLSMLFAGTPNMTFTQALFQNLTSFFQTTFQMEARLITPVQDGLDVILRSKSHSYLTCLWDHVSAGRGDRVFSDLFYEVQNMEEYVGTKVTASIEEREFNMYSYHAIKYQESGTCGLDFSHVNHHVFSFIGFSTILLVIFPAFVSGYFCLKCFLRRRPSLGSRSPNDHKLHKDLDIAASYAVSTLFTLAFQCAYLTINIMGGLNYQLPKWIYLLSHVLIFMCPLSLPLSCGVVQICAFLKLMLSTCLSNDPDKDVLANHRQVIHNPSVCDTLLEMNKIQKAESKRKVPCSSDSVSDGPPSCSDALIVTNGGTEDTSLTHIP